MVLAPKRLGTYWRYFAIQISRDRLRKKINIFKTSKCAEDESYSERFVSR